jgi:hypothetical protein
MPSETPECEFQLSSAFKLFPDVSMSHAELCRQCCCYDARHRSDTADRREVEVHPIRLNSPCCPYQQGFL